MEIFNVLFFKPSFNFIVFLTTILPGNDLGLAVVIYALFLNIFFKIFSPDPQKIEKIKKEIEELRNKYKEKGKDILNQEIIQVYKKEGINPLLSFIFPVLQLIIVFAFFISLNQLRDGISIKEKEQLYFFIPPPSISNYFLGFIDLEKPFLVYGNSLKFYWPTFILVLPNIFLNFILFKKTTNVKKSTLFLFQKQFFYLSLFFSLVIPAIFVLYWLVNTIYSLILVKIKKHGSRNN